MTNNYLGILAQMDHIRCILSSFQADSQIWPGKWVAKPQERCTSQDPAWMPLNFEVPIWRK